MDSLKKMSYMGSLRPGEETLGKWLSDTGLPIKKFNSKSFAIQMSHQYVDYWAEVVDHGEWTSIAAVLFGEVVGRNSQEFYRFVLELNTSLNAAHIAVDSGRIVLVGNFPSEDVTKYRLFRDLSYFHQTHEYVYGLLLDKAEEFKVAFKPL
ncbi:hypothetical protein [Pantanalinema sp. GBBB05]|uniref:hypothetical protein n=1 Tax=Pantanalinema sp. GBBB05 TaxID=2604139 RepID=UPI001DB42A71|nr:YbjN domain-containing protein [Pantanalinema sp. GBBB05]